MGPLGELGALFNPGMRHEIEERQAKANRREEEGNARDGDLRIDLASGVAVISVSNGGDHSAAPAAAPYRPSTPSDAADVQAPVQDAPSEQSTAPAEQSGGRSEQSPAASQRSDNNTGTPATVSAADSTDMPPTDDAVAADGARRAAARGGKPLTAAQARRLATAARRSANGDQPARTATPRPANAQLPSSKASRAAR